MKYTLVLSLSLSSVFAISAQGDVSSWRNGGNGEYPDSQPPINWKENTLWETPLETWSNASPILIGKRLYFCQEPSTLICVDSRSGGILWERSLDKSDLLGFTAEQKAEADILKAQDEEYRREVNRLNNEYRRLRRRSRQDPDNEALKEQLQAKGDETNAAQTKLEELANREGIAASTIAVTHPTNGYTSFTPISDGKHVYAAFGQGMLAAFDLDGNEVWSKAMERPDPANGEYEWGGSTSPILVDGKLIVRFADLTALDPLTGDEIWRIPSEVFYGTPGVFEIEGQSFLFLPRGEVIQASDGKTIQSGLVTLHHNHPWSVFSSPVIENGIIYTARGFNFDGPDGHVYALRIPETLDALREKGLEQIWSKEIHANRYYASPIVHDGLVYVLSANLMLTVLDEGTGEAVYEKRIEGLRGTAYPSLALAGDTLFFASDEGTLVALQPGREYKELARNRFDAFRSTPIFENSTAYLRTYSSLYAIRNQ